MKKSPPGPLQCLYCSRDLPQDRTVSKNLYLLSRLEGVRELEIHYGLVLKELVAKSPWVGFRVREAFESRFMELPL